MIAAIDWFEKFFFSTSVFECYQFYHSVHELSSLNKQMDDFGRGKIILFISSSAKFQDGTSYLIKAG